MLLEMLKLCSGPEGALFDDSGSEVAVQLATVLMQLLAVPPDEARDCSPTAAEAVEGLQEAELTWEHLDVATIAQAGTL